MMSPSEATTSHVPRPRRVSATGVALLVVGALLLAAAAAYYAYGFFAGRDLDRLDVTVTGPVSETLPRAAGTTHEGPSPAAQELYPGSLMPARQWADPRGAINLGVPDLEGFIPLSNEGQPHIAGVVGRAERIVIPQLNVDAEVEELSIINLASSAAYETPAFTVGHIPTTPNPGSAGNGWYFGHLENPIQGEGNVFLRLPEIADLLRDGDDVHVILTSGGRDYLYLVNGTSTTHADDLALYPSDDARISLVTCFPRLKYDQRLIVTAQLVAFRDIPAAEGA
ncbi:MAG: sortase [Chloroflexi bacterium]|nr:sortase [Chloroflexota bacterium]MYB84839.1 sortase [Chloroflexota bacterium]